MINHKTDNSSLASKVKFRTDRLPSDPIRVLDCYHGSGACWRNIKRLTGRTDITVDGLDIEDKGSFTLLGDNQKTLPNITLSKYNVIDVDSYGVPYDILKDIFSYQGEINAIIYFTMCLTFMRKVPNELLEDIGFTKKMCSEAPVFVSKNGVDKFFEWLSLNEVKEAEYISLPGNGVHIYGAFKIHRTRKDHTPLFSK